MKVLQNNNRKYNVNSKGHERTEKMKNIYPCDISGNLKDYWFCVAVNKIEAKL